MRFDKFLCFAFCCWLLVDTINGFAKTNGIEFPVSQVFKFGVFLLLLIRLRNVCFVRVITILVFGYLLLLLVHVSSTIGSSLDIYILLMKPLTSFYIFLYFRHLAKTNLIYFRKKFFQIIVINFIFLAVNILIGLLGFGNHSYNVGEEGIGIRGFIYAQNEVSCVVAVLFPFVLWFVRRSMSKGKYYLACVVIVFIAFSMSTKAAILVALLTVFFITYYVGDKNERKMVVMLSIICIILILSFVSYVLTLEVGFLDRFMFFYEKNGLAEAMLSGRWQFWQEAKADFFSHDMITQLFGLCNASTCEMDPFDALLNLGYVGCFLNVIFLLYLLFAQRKTNCRTELFKILRFSNTLIVFISLFSGHIFFSSMGTMFVALSNSGAYNMEKTKNADYQ